MNRLFKVNNIQITLDVLAELIKFSPLNLIYFNVILLHENWTKWTNKIFFKNTIDSNLLIRAVYLSYEEFTATKSSP